MPRANSSARAGWSTDRAAATCRCWWTATNDLAQGVGAFQRGRPPPTELADCPDAAARDPSPSATRRRCARWGASGAGGSWGVGDMRPLLVPGAAAGVLAAYLLIPGVRATPGLLWAFAGSAAGVLAWTLWLAVSRRRAGEASGGGIPGHQTALGAVPGAGNGPGLVGMVRACGLRIRPVHPRPAGAGRGRRGALQLDAARSSHTLGFGPVPVVFSLNLFLWFDLAVVLPSSWRWWCWSTSARSSSAGA